MTSKQWIEENPHITIGQVVNELIEWRGRAKTYQKQVFEAQRLLVESKYDLGNTVLAWANLKPKVYYKQEKPYGLLGTTEGTDGILYIAGMVANENDSFTKDMIKDIIALYETRTICLITDVESKQELIRRVLGRYNFTFSYKDGIMYSTGRKIWE